MDSEGAQIDRDRVGKWSSNNPTVLSINSQTGQAIGKLEGKADVLLSNHINAASIVHVTKVKYAQPILRD